jgi:hypothetical protein
LYETLSMQLTNPWVLLALVIYAAFIVAPLIAWIGAQTWQRRVAPVAVLFCILCSLPAFFSTPDGVIGDTIEYGGRWSTVAPTNWQQFFGGTDVTHGTGWILLPLSWGWAAFGTWKVERIIGLIWHCLFVLSMCAFPFVDAALLPITVVIACATRFGLWIQRHHLGSEILLQQALLLGCLLRARQTERWRWLAPVAALVAILQYSYLAAMVTITYPLIWLRRSWRTLGVYGLTLLLCVPLLITPGSYFVTAIYDPDHHPAFPSWQHIFASVLSFWNESYSRERSWMWSYRGAQHLPLLVCLLILCGIALALWNPEGRRWIATAIVGLVPTLPWPGPIGSHHQMMCLIPLAVLAAWPVRHLPAGWVLPVSISLAAAIAWFGLREWHDPAFWVLWHNFGWHGFTQPGR